jgi:hypothetical protein
MAVYGKPVEANGESINVSISIGVAAFPSLFLGQQF